MAVLAFTALSMSAQEDSKFSAYVGVGLSNVVGSDAKLFSGALSYKVGFCYDGSISNSFSVIPAIEFANKAVKHDNIYGTVNRFYVQVPILAAYKFNLSDNTNLAIKAGPYVGYGAFGSDIEWYGGGTTNIFDEIERLDAGIRAGLSVDFSQFTVGVEFSHSFTKVLEDYSAYNQGFGATFGYKF